MSYESAEDPLNHSDQAGSPFATSSAQVVPNLSPLAPRSPLPGQPNGHYRPQGLASPPSSNRPLAHSTASGEWDGRSQQSTSNLTFAPRSAITQSPDKVRDGVGSMSSESSRTPPADAFVRMRIVGLEKTRRDIFIKFNAESNLPSFRSATYRSVSRSYTEFARFAEAIAAECPQSIIPALPLAQTSAATDEEDDRLVKASFQRWVARITSDTAIMRDDELRSFVESDFGYTPSTRSRRKAPPTFHFPRGSRLPGEQDDDLTLAKSAMSKLEANFNETSKATERLSRSRRSVAQALVEVGDHFHNFAMTETYTPLANGIKKVARTTKVTADIYAVQATMEQVTLSDAMAYQALNARSAKDTLMSRDVILDEHRVAAKATISKRKAIERLKGSSNIKADRVDEALEELDDAKRQEVLLAQRLSAISQNLQPSLRTHARNAHQDILTALLHHAQTVLLYEKQLLKEFELLRPELHAIKKPQPGVYYHTTPSLASSKSALGSPTMQTRESLDRSQSSFRGGAGTGRESDRNADSAERNRANSMAVGRGSPNFSRGLIDDIPTVSSNQAATRRSVHSMAKSVVVADDRRQRVDSRMAASLLANGF